MLRQHARRIHHFVLASDMGLSALTFTWLATLPAMRDPLARPEAVTFAFEALGVLACLAWPLVLDRFGIYGSHRREDLAGVLRSLAGASAAGVVMLSAVAFAIAAPIAPQFPIAFGALNFAALAGLRTGALAVLRTARRAGANTRNLLVVGSGARAEYVQRVITSTRSGACGSSPSWTRASRTEARGCLASACASSSTSRRCCATRPSTRPSSPARARCCRPSPPWYTPAPPSACR